MRVLARAIRLLGYFILCYNTARIIRCLLPPPPQSGSRGTDLLQQTNCDYEHVLSGFRVDPAAIMLAVLLHASPAEPGLRLVLPLDLRQVS